MDSIISFVCFYIIGLVFALMIYDVEFYEKNNGRIFEKFQKKNLINSTILLSSWIYVIIKIYKFIKKQIMKTIKKICKAIGKSYMDYAKLCVAQYTYRH